MNAYQGGVHGEIDAGAIDLGLVVTEAGLGVALDAPVIGQLRAAFDVLGDGSTKLTALSRQGVPVLGLGDPSRVTELELELEAKQAELTRSKATLTQTDLKLRTAQADGAAAKAALEEAHATLRQSHAELAAAGKAQAEAEGRMRRLQTQADLAKEELDARTGASAAELSDLGARLQQADERRATQDALLEQSRAELQRVTAEKEAQSQRAQASELERDEALRKLQLSEDTRHSDADRAATELSELRLTHLDALTAEQAAAAAQTARADGLEAQLKDAQALIDRQTAELDEERSRHDEMVRDLAYIQTQVADLAGSKGALVARIGAMKDRETKRQRTTAELSDVLRTTEVVAADTKASARRYEARAVKLEDQVRGMTQEIAELRGRAEVAETSVLMLGEQLSRTTQERDALKIDVAFFQKQIGAMQRAAAQEKAKPKK